MNLDVQRAKDAIGRIAKAVEEHKDYLTELDSAIGDADHGINLNRGFSKAWEKVNAGSYADVGGVFRDVAMSMMSSVGGASGPLYGTLFMKMSAKLAGKSEADASLFAESLRDGLAGIVALGKAQVGDKTMVDALTPAADALSAEAASGADLISALKRTLEAAEEGMKSTIPLVARKGRASYLGERSAGHQDPGATSTLLILNCFLEAVSE
jgi:dihydroxyacetone kinase-like protein